jgi:dienelactone hydrolase
MNKTPKTTTYFLMLIACSAFMTGCFMSPSPLTPEQQSEKIGQYIAKGGYSAVVSYDIKSISETWRHDGQAVDISMLTPTTPGAYPLIIYLPGLGEQADEGKLWRETWAKAGYAVFSVQPLEIANALKVVTPMSSDDKQPADSSWSLFTSSKDKDKAAALKAVRNSDLRYLGHEYFSQASLIKRINHVLWAYAQLQQRTKAKQGLFAAADLSRVVIAGYDIGAQTAAAMIGEKYDAILPQAPDFIPLAAILLSPSVDIALGDVTTRYQNISIPLLAVTGTEDDDPYAISTPYARTAIWENAPPGNKCLLLLKKGNHQLFAGNNLSQKQESNAEQESVEKPETGTAAPRFSNSYGGGGGKGHSGGGSQGGMGKSKGGSRQNGAQDYNHVAAIFSVSIAFLDHVCKHDSVAGSWLSAKANPWLDKSASLKIK